MGTKKNSTWSQAIVNLLLAIPSLYNVIANFISYLEYEVHLAKKSIITLAILSCLAIVICASMWFCLWTIFFMALIKWLTPLSVLLIIFASHIVLLIITFIWIAKTKENLLFSRTRGLFH